MAERGLRSEGCRRRASRSPPLHEPGKRREARARAPSREAPPRPQTQGQRGNARRRKGKLREKRGEPAPARPGRTGGSAGRPARGRRWALRARTLGSARPRGRGERVKRRRPVGGEGEGGKQEERRALAGWDGRPDGERCRKTEAGAAARGDRPEAPRSARQARAARRSLGDLRTRGPGHRGRTSHPAASRRRDSGEGGKTPIPILCSNK